MAEAESIYLVRLVLLEPNSAAGPFLYRGRLPKAGDVIVVEPRSRPDAPLQARVTLVAEDDVLPIRATEIDPSEPEAG